MIKLHKRAYSDLLLSTSGTSRGYVPDSKTAEHPRGDAVMAWKALKDRFAPKDTTDKVSKINEWSTCVLKSQVW